MGSDIKQNFPSILKILYKPALCEQTKASRPSDQQQLESRKDQGIKGNQKDNLQKEHTKSIE